MLANDSPKRQELKHLLLSMTKEVSNNGNQKKRFIFHKTIQVCIQIDWFYDERLLQKWFKFSGAVASFVVVFVHIWTSFKFLKRLRI
jgi:hypothetical protein